LEVVLARDVGFCLGVKRAMRLASETARRAKGPIYTLGPLVHNPHAIEELSSKGIRIIEGFEDIPPGVVILRSHGAPPHILEEARMKGFRVVDATCPRVKRVQRLATRLKRDGYSVVVIGDANHPEVVSIVEGVGDAWVVEDKDSASSIPFSSKMGIISQTTQDANRFMDLLRLLIPKSKEVRIFNTICDASIKRQKSSLDLAREVDVMIVVGGYNSANTNRIVDICKGVTETHHIEYEGEIRQEWFKGTKRVGVTSGTSTPYEVILRAVDRIESYRDKG
jgi:4-hydroxy-3-methylbut-2-enyl diphosphate reductase